MDFIKVFDQTVRDLKREVNLKVLKVPEIEQKVLDATSNEAWGPHGSALSELAQSTKKFTECQMIMNVLWTRLTDTGANWRHVYKALAVIEYLVANGSERAVDDILEHTFQISSLSGFEYVEPNGKDVGINVRKKAETILALLNDKEKIQAARNKAAANRDKYFGLSSTGITYKSSSASYSSGSSYNGNRYGGFGSSKEGDSFKDSYKDSEHESKWNQVNRDGRNKSKENLSDENEENKLKKGVSHHAEAKPGPVPSSKSPSTQPVSNADDFDDFDPRGSSTAGSANTSSNQVDLFGESLFGDLMDAPAPIPTETTITNNAVAPEVDLFADAAFISAPPQAEGQTGTETTITNNAVAPEVDLFADAAFISAPPQAEGQTGSHTQGNIDFFTSEPAFPSSVAPNVDLFAATDTSLPPETKSHDSEPSNTNAFDPFAAIPLNNFEGSDLFGSLTSHTEPATSEYSQNKGNNSLNQTSSTASKPAPKKDSFQVKSGIWADSLSRGLIDLNISAPKKANLADLGIVGGLSDGSDEKDKGTPPLFYMGRAMGAGTGLGMSGFPSYPTTMGGSGSFSNLGQQQYGSFK